MVTGLLAQPLYEREVPTFTHCYCGPVPSFNASFFQISLDEEKTMSPWWDENREHPVDVARYEGWDNE